MKSNMKGVVYDVLKKEGELINTQTALAVIGADSSFILEMEVDQADITRINPGQIVYLTMDSYKGQVFEARITKIFPIMDERTRTFKVEAEFINPPNTLYPNLTAEANIVVLQKKAVLTIPKSYLVDGKYVIVDGETKREIKTGLRDYQKVEILEGLDTSTAVFKP